MNLKFEKIRAHNFSCYKDVELDLMNMGYTIVSGKNNSSSDNAVSNGSGKSSIFNAICYAITGETTQGLSNNVENIYTNPNDCWVELQFKVDDDDFVIKRFKTPRPDLKIFINGDDRSGKGIRESQQFLDNYLPDINSRLLGSIIILGQGLPYRFTYNTPSQRKYLLEKLTKSDFMVQTVKDKLESRKEELKKLLRSYEDDNIENDTKIKLYFEQLNKLKEDLDEYEDCSSEGSIDDKILDIKESIISYNDEMILIQNNIDSLNISINDLMNQKSKLSEEDSLTLTENLKLIDTKINESLKDVTEKESEYKSIEKEIIKLDSITDICPTCGQKIHGIHKIDTSDLKIKLEDSKKVLLSLKEDYKDKIDKKDLIISNHRSEFNLKYKNINDEISKLQKQINDNEKKFNSIRSLSQSLIKEETRLKTLQDTYVKLVNDAKLLSDKINDLQDLKYVIENNIKDTNEHLNVVQNLITLAKREFRSVLLENIIKYLDKKSKQYSYEVFGAELITIKTDENYIDVIFNDKYYEALSGGEKQKVDIIIQLALRDLLSNQLNIHSNILVLDEVLDFLDEKGADAILRLIQNYVTDIESIFMISHRVEKLNISYDTILEVIKDTNNVSSIYIR